MTNIETRRATPKQKTARCDESDRSDLDDLFVEMPTAYQRSGWLAREAEIDERCRRTGSDALSGDAR